MEDSQEKIKTNYHSEMFCLLLSMLQIENRKYSYGVTRDCGNMGEEVVKAVQIINNISEEENTKVFLVKSKKLQKKYRSKNFTEEVKSFALAFCRKNLLYAYVPNDGEYSYKARHHIYHEITTVLNTGIIKKEEAEKDIGEIDALIADDFAPLPFIQGVIKNIKFKLSS